MGIVPKEWMPPARMKRIICHWTAGAHEASALDRKHYHIVVEGDGELVRGRVPIDENERTGDGRYAAHTLGANTGSIGVAVCCMAGANERPFRPGSHPMRESQWRRLAAVVAELCEAYEIPVTPKTVLGHGEVERNLGIRQKGKWDPLLLPWAPQLSPRDVGDTFRGMVAALLDRTEDEVPPPALKVTVNGTPVPDAISINEGSYLKLSGLEAALGWSIVGGDAERVSVALPGDGGTVLTLPHDVFGGEEIAPDAADEAVVAALRAAGYVSVVAVAHALSLPLAVDFDGEVLLIGSDVPMTPVAGAGTDTAQADGGAAASGRRTRVPRPKPRPEPAPVAAAARTVEVRRGDTLGAIAERHLGSASKWSKLTKPDGSGFSEADARRLKVGDVVVLPGLAAPAPLVEAAEAEIEALVEAGLEEVLAAAAAEIRSEARVSVPLILAACGAAGITDPGQVAYVLATSEHESKCGRFMRELWGPTADQRRYEGRGDLGNTKAGDGYRYRGRGYVQITGRANYATWAKRLGRDIVADPDLVAREPAVAAEILVLGMRDGAFRPRAGKLAGFIAGDRRDFLNARELINGDKARVDKGHTRTRGQRVAAIAERYFRALAGG
jgi:LysM repeat protein